MVPLPWFSATYYIEKRETLGNDYKNRCFPKQLQPLNYNIILICKQISLLEDLIMNKILLECVLADC